MARRRRAFFQVDFIPAGRMIAADHIGGIVMRHMLESPAVSILLPPLAQIEIPAHAILLRNLMESARERRLEPEQLGITIRTDGRYAEALFGVVLSGEGSMDPSLSELLRVADPRSGENVAVFFRLDDQARVTARVDHARIAAKHYTNLIVHHRLLW